MRSFPNKKSSNFFFEFTVIAYAKSPSINIHAQLLSGIRGLIFSLSPFLIPFFVNASNEGSCKTVQVHRLVLALTARKCDQFQNLMCWFN